MVLRLFVPPGEGQHKLVPKRPDPIGANATLQYTILASTSVAAAYTTFASTYAQRVPHAHPISTTGLFVRSSARLGIWAGLAGAALNWYYYSAFASIVIRDTNPSVKPWKLYKWTKRRTVDDGALAGAALGLAASIPTLFMRRPAIPRWTRCVGMANIGASAGILGAHGYFEYTGERQKAYKRLQRRLKRKSLEFWAIFWNKPLMAQFDPLMQQYVRHNGLWYSSNMPDSVFEEPDAYGRRTVRNKTQKDNAAAPTPTEPPQEEPAYYTQPFDYAEDLKQIDVDFTVAKMVELRAEKQALLDEAEYLVIFTAQKEYEYCHIKDMDDEERQRRLQEIHLCEIAYNRVRTAATTIDIKLVKWDMSLQHKGLWDASPDLNDPLESWMPKSSTIQHQRHSPTISIQEFEKFQTQISGEVKRFEELIRNRGYTKAQRERWRKDLEDGRVLLKAIDHLVHDLEKRQKMIKDQKSPSKTMVEDVNKEKASQVGNAEAIQSQAKKDREGADKDSDGEDGEKTQVVKVTKPSKDGGLNSGSS